MAVPDRWQTDRQTLSHALSPTVFSLIEAPGAKEMVWGASIIFPEAPNFEINMVKKDNKKSHVFFSLKTHTQNTNTMYKF